MYFSPNIPLTLNRDFPVEGKNNQQVYKKESWLLIVQQQNPVGKNVRQGLFMTVRPIFLARLWSCKPTGKSKGFLDDRPGLGGWTELVKWRAVNILQVPEVESDVGKSDVCKEGCN